MPVIAQWGPKTFEVSTEKIVAFGELSTSLKLKKQTNNDDSGSAPTNVRAYELQPLSFDLPVSDAVGVDVRGEYEEWLTLVGEVYPFYLGGQPFGPDNLQLSAVDLTGKVDGFGRIRHGVIKLDFSEWAQEAASQKGRPGAYVTIQTSSAVSVGPTADDKAAKKPVVI